MPQMCSACVHAQRVQIDAALISGESCPSIAARFGLRHGVVKRHLDHVRARVRAAQEQRESLAGESIVAQVESLNERTLLLLEQLEQEEDRKTALLAVKEVRANIELLAKLTGRLTKKVELSGNVDVSSWLDLVQRATGEDISDGGSVRDIVGDGEEAQEEA